MKKFDSISKNYIANNERFADLFNCYIFRGEPVLTAEGLEERDAEEIVVPYYGKQYQAVQKFRDILKACVVKEAEGAVYVLFGVENQTHIHYAMPLRNMLYDAMNFASQAEKLAGKNRKEGLLRGSAEYLSGMKKDDRLNPVVTLTLYWGTEKWDGPRSLHEMMAGGDPAVMRYVPDYRMNLISPAEMDVDSLKRLHTDLGQVFGGIRAAAKGAEFLRELEADPAFRSLNAESARVLSAAIGLEVDIPEEGVVDMCKALEDLTRESRDEGRAEGRAEGRLEAMSESVLALAETLKIGIDQAMDYLKVAPEYREECRRLLNKF